jgi:tRNA-2-methylthio-N6-dimethylallyladenosine synthase
MKYFIKTFGCQQNKADSERVAAGFRGRGMTEALTYEEANYVVLNTCMVRRSAEDRVYGLVINLGKIKEEKKKKNEVFKIIVTGCMVGLAFRDKTGNYLSKIRERMPQVDEFMPIEEVGFDNEPVRQNDLNAWVPISNGCNNFCTFCVVPYTRGREISRPYEDIIAECERLRAHGYKTVTLLGQNVNSYGADLIVGEQNVQVMRDIDKKYFESNQSSPGYDASILTSNKSKDYKLQTMNDIGISNIRHFTINGRDIKPIYVKHLGRQRIPTLFPYLLEEVAQMGFEKVDFFSANPWDYSDDLIDVIARNPNITRTLHLPIQSGSTTMLRRMNRWYTRDEYLQLVAKLKFKILNLKLTTDIIVGFCGETDEEFLDTVDLCKKVGYSAAYIAMYSPRPMTAATKIMIDDIPYEVKKKRWEKLDEIVNKTNLRNGTYAIQYAAGK